MVELDELKKHLQEGQFPAGSMGPKVKAAVDFLEARGDRAIITSAANLIPAVNGLNTGTQVVRSHAAAVSLQRTLTVHAT